jgi:hypothetical protein
MDEEGHVAEISHCGYKPRQLYGSAYWILSMYCSNTDGIPTMEYPEEITSKMKHIQQQLEEDSVIHEIQKYHQKQKEYLCITCINGT